MSYMDITYHSDYKKERKRETYCFRKGYGRFTYFTTRNW